MKLVRTGTSHYLKSDTATLPKSTLMWHYAIDGTEEEIEELKTAKGAYFRTIDSGKYEGKPIHFTSKMLCEVDTSIDCSLVNGQVSVSESTEERELKSARQLKDRTPLTARQKLFLAEAGKAGVTVSMPD